NHPPHPEPAVPYYWIRTATATELRAEPVPFRQLSTSNGSRPARATRLPRYRQVPGTAPSTCRYSVPVGYRAPDAVTCRYPPHPPSPQPPVPTCPHVPTTARETQRKRCVREKM